MFLALDLASRLTGWAAGDGSRLPDVGVCQIEPVNGDYGYLLEQLDQYLVTLFRRFRPTHCAYESPILVARGGANRYGDKLSTLRLLYPMGAYVELFCRRAEVACFEVSLQDVKRELTGKSNAQKADMVEVARRIGVNLPSGPGREDAADALGCWLKLLRANDRKAAEQFDKAIYGRNTLL